MFGDHHGAAAPARGARRARRQGRPAPIRRRASPSSSLITTTASVSDLWWGPAHPCQDRRHASMRHRQRHDHRDVHHSQGRDRTWPAASAELIEDAVTGTGSLRRRRLKGQVTRVCVLESPVVESHCGQPVGSACDDNTGASTGDTTPEGTDGTYSHDPIACVELRWFVESCRGHVCWSTPARPRCPCRGCEAPWAPTCQAKEYVSLARTARSGLSLTEEQRLREYLQDPVERWETPAGSRRGSRPGQPAVSP